MRTAFTGISNNFLIKAGLKDVRSGDILSVKILENKNGLIKATVGGKIISLKGGKDLTPGILIRVRARWNGKNSISGPSEATAIGAAGNGRGWSASCLLFDNLSGSRTGRASA